MLRRLFAPLFVLCLAVLTLGDPPDQKPAGPPTIYRIAKGKHYDLPNCPESKKKGAKVAAITPALAQAANPTPCLKCRPPSPPALAPAKPSGPKPADATKPAEPPKPPP